MWLRRRRHPHPDADEPQGEALADIGEQIRTRRRLMTTNEKQSISLLDDGQTGTIEYLEFTDRTLHRQLVAVDPDARPGVLIDALSLGAEMRARVMQQGDLENLTRAVERLDEESTRIVAATVDRVDRTIEKTIGDMAATMQGDGGPLAELLQRFDPAADGNVIDLFRDLVSTTAAKATKEAGERPF
jgi:hypothetical protein